MGLKKSQEQEFARVLFVSENLSQKEIAERVGITEKTLSKWIEAGAWQKLKRSMLTTKQNQLGMLYDQLEWQNTLIADRDIKVATTKEADVISKITAAIQRLEVETSIGVIVEVARDCIESVRQYDLDLAKRMTSAFDMFIQSKMK